MKWIDIKDQKPEHKQRVLISGRQMVGSREPVIMTAVYYAEDRHNKEGWIYNHCITLDVTHWMPLPEPPVKLYKLL